MPPTTKNRLIALSLIALLLLGGAGAGIALRPRFGGGSAPAAQVSESKRQALAQATSLSDAFIAIAETVTPAVVRIQVERTVIAPETRPLSGQLQDLFGRARPDQTEPVPQVIGGSGFIVSADGYILTNYHVIAGAERILVTLRDNRVLDAAVVGTDPATDIAVIKISARDLPAVTLGDSDAARVGEWVLAIGNPDFADASTLDFTVTSGIISAKNRPLDILNLEVENSASASAIEDFIQTDAVINPGNSGGPLIDLKGTVIGINSAIASSTGFSQGYGFAIPSNLVRRIMTDLIDHGYVHRALLGITIANVSPEDAEVYRLPAIAGVIVEDFAEDSPARESGLKRHDVIVSVDGRPVQRVNELQRLIALHHPGDVVPLVIIRYGQRREVRVRLMEVPGNGGRPAQQRRPASAPPMPTTGLGLQLAELTPALARQYGYTRAGGALIVRVAPASAAYRKDIQEGDRIVAIDGDTIASLAEASARLERLITGKIVSLLLQTAAGRTYIANVRVP